MKREHTKRKKKKEEEEEEKEEEKQDDNTYPGLESFPMFSQIRSARRQATNAVPVPRAGGTIHCLFLDFYFVPTLIERRSRFVTSSKSEVSLFIRKLFIHIQCLRYCLCITVHRWWTKFLIIKYTLTIIICYWKDICTPSA